MSTTVSVVRVKIERIVSRATCRGTPSAMFQRLDGFFLCEAWFESGDARMRVRSSAHGLEESEQIVVAIGLAQDWILEEVAQGNNVRPILDKVVPQ